CGQWWLGGGTAVGGCGRTIRHALTAPSGSRALGWGLVMLRGVPAQPGRRHLARLGRDRGLNHHRPSRRPRCVPDQPKGLARDSAVEAASLGAPKKAVEYL